MDGDLSKLIGYYQTPDGQQVAEEFAMMDRLYAETGGGSDTYLHSMGLGVFTEDKLPRW
jgi:hypothetical protein